MRKIMLVLCALLFILVTPVVFTGCDNTTQGMLYEKIDGKKEYSLYDLGNAKGGKVVIPSEYNGLPVTAISDEAFKGESSITSIFIPDSVKEIGKMAFYDCRNLESVTLPSGLKEISYRLFVNCHKLKEIIIPDGVIKIGVDAFKCSGLQNIVIPDKVEFIGYESFYGCAQLKSVVIGKNVNNIQPNAFLYCNNLTSATFVDPENWKLTGITFGEGNLKDPQKLASYFTDELYCSRIWTKEVSGE